MNKAVKKVLGFLDLAKLSYGLGLKSNRRHVLVACMPKSGSTFLTTLIAGFPSMHNISLVPDYGRREQELDTLRLISNHRQDYVAQHHVRYSRVLSDQIETYGLKPVVMVRNIFDVCISHRDHIRNESAIGPMSYATSKMAEWDNEKLERYIADMIIPWHFNYYLSWCECKKKLFINYEELIDSPTMVLENIMRFYDLPYSDEDVNTSIEKARRNNTRLNKGVSGRGEELSLEAREHIMRMASYYIDYDLSPLGL